VLDLVPLPLSSEEIETSRTNAHAEQPDATAVDNICQMIRNAHVPAFRVSNATLLPRRVGRSDTAAAAPSTHAVRPGEGDPPLTKAGPVSDACGTHHHERACAGGRETR
jgi:hypothetical protein